MSIRLLAVVLSLALVLLSSGVASAAPVRYFKVAPRPGAPMEDSFILPLSRWQDIFHARVQIRQPRRIDLPRIVTAHIAKGYDGINRDLDADAFRPWRWHVTEFDGFFDVTAELYDSTPTYVNNNIVGWMRETGGYIGFWEYRVVAELPNFNPPAAAAPATHRADVVPTPVAATAGAGMLAAALLRRRSD